MLDKAIQRCAREIVNSDNTNWVIGYSGGKDSTATLKVFLTALKLAKRKDDRVTVIYCDTGVENPVLDKYVKYTLKNIERELVKDFTNSSVEILKAPVNERFFVRIIGRGYAPPTNRFRWCTKGLRVNPVRRYINSQDGQFVVVLRTSIWRKQST